MNVEETPIRVEIPSDLKKAEDNDFYSAVWSFGKHINMMPDDISSAYDEYGIRIPDEYATFNLIIEQNNVK